MKVKIVSLLFLFVINLTFSQVGIYTTSPQAALHVAGNSSTIRIDSLNQTNNATNFVAGKDNRLHVNVSGNLVLDDSSYTPNLLVDVPTTITITTPNFTATDVITATGNRKTATILSGTFDTTKAGLVKVIFSVSVNKIIRKTAPANGKDWLVDGDARLIGVNCFINGKLVSQSAKIYMSKKVSGGNNAVAEDVLTLEAKVFVNLPKKTGVTYKLEAVIEGESKPAKATFAATGLNSFQVITY